MGQATAKGEIGEAMILADLQRQVTGLPYLSVTTCPLI